MVADTNEEQSGSNAILWILLLAIVMAGLCSMATPMGFETTSQKGAAPPAAAVPVQAAPIPGNGRLSQHAIERHGQDAIVAADWVSNNGQNCCYPCADGRTRCACRMPDGKFAVAVLEGDFIVTAFLSRSPNYIQNMLRDQGCTR